MAQSIGRVTEAKACHSIGRATEPRAGHKVYDGLESPEHAAEYSMGQSSPDGIGRARKPRAGRRA